MTEQEVVDLMKSSNTEQEWNDNCDKVKKACSGYPSFWFKAIILSGVAGEVTARFGKDDKIHVSALKLSKSEPEPIPPYTEDQQYSLVSVMVVALRQFDNRELAAFNLIMNTQDKLIPAHAPYKKAVELHLINEDGTSPEPDLLRKALAHEVMKRYKAGIFNL